MLLHQTKFASLAGLEPAFTFHGLPPRELHELSMDQIVEHLDYLELKGGDDGQ